MDATSNLKISSPRASSLNAHREVMQQCCLHYDDVYRIIRARVDDHETASDLTQDVFERAVRKQDQLDGITSLMGWLAAVAINLTRDHWRRNRYAPVSESILDLSALTLSDGSPEDRFVDGQGYDEHFANISITTRETFDLYILEGWTVAEIAVVQHSTVSAVQRRISRAKQLLRDDWHNAAE